MPTREERAAEAAKHIGLLRQVFVQDTQTAIDSARLYKEGEGRSLPEPAARFEATDIRVERTDCVSVVLAMGGADQRACVLDFASYLYPGGGYERGAWAQEEALCAESNLFEVLNGLRDVFYTPNRQTVRGGLYSDRALYLTDIVFTTEGNPRKRDVIVCAAPHRTRALESNRSEVECDSDMRKRVQTVMQIAAAQEVDALVLGAFGCGVFGNDPAFVAAAFKEWLDSHPGVFAEVVFAIPGGPNLAAFEEVFGPVRSHVVEEPEDTDEQEEDTSEEDAWLAENATSDGRWVFN